MLTKKQKEKFWNDLRKKNKEIIDIKFMGETAKGMSLSGLQVCKKMNKELKENVNKKTERKIKNKNL